MTFIPNTPESLVTRSDSKNAATTCKGITSSGLPCRRSLGRSPARFFPLAQSRRSILTSVQNVSAYHERAAVFYCWQHKDQAAPLIAEFGNLSKIVELNERSSIDTLAERIGILHIQDNTRTRQNGNPQRAKLTTPATLPNTREDGPAPHPAVQANHGHSKSSNPRQSRQNRNLHFSFFCCMRLPDDDPVPSSRHRQKQRPSMTQTARLPVNHESTRRRSLPPQERPRLQNNPSSHTTTLLSLIPPSLSPATTSLLLAELAKPRSAFDKEPGYIYIFWHTPSAVSVSAADRVPSLLLPANTTTTMPPRGRRTSELLRSVADSSTPRTVLLKIGRASNVQRRMNEWTRQCGQPLALLRYYPYSAPSSSSCLSSSAHPDPAMPRKVACVQRLERLVHLELAARRVRRACAGCARQHREWFEVEASREAVAAVDAVVRRWVAWAEREDPHIEH